MFRKDLRREKVSQVQFVVGGCCFNISYKYAVLI